MKKNKHMGSSVSEHIKQLSKDRGFRVDFERQMEKERIAKLVRDLRKREGLSITDLAQKANVKRSYISRLENATGSYLPRLDTLNQILESIGYTTSLTVTKMKKAA